MREHEREERTRGNLAAADLSAVSNAELEAILGAPNERRPRRGSICGQPVQPVQKGKKFVIAVGRGLVRLHSSEQTQRAAGRIAEEVIPRPVVELDNQGLEQLTNDPPAKTTLQARSRAPATLPSRPKRPASAPRRRSTTCRCRPAPRRSRVCPHPRGARQSGVDHRSSPARSRNTAATIRR